jgi:hypothetical protein
VVKVVKEIMIKERGEIHSDEGKNIQGDDIKR